MSNKNLFKKFVPFLHILNTSVFTKNLPCQYNYNICSGANKNFPASVYVQSNQVELIMAHTDKNKRGKKKRREITKRAEQRK